MSARAERPGDARSPLAPGGSGRLVSLDAFRGITIAAMTVVNNPGSWRTDAIFAPLRHAEWHGCTPTDLVFPFFLFIVGVAIPYSLASRAEAGLSFPRLALRIARRAVVLFLLGMFLRAFPDFAFAGIRIPGVLQRIGAVYLFAALLAARTRWRAPAAVAAALLLGYWALLSFVPVPGGAAGVLEKKGNLAAWLDLALMQSHLYEPAWDPEGILSTIPAIATALLGVVAGHWLRSARAPAAKARGLFAAGAAATLVGWAWGAVFPLNKNLWTSSYALYTAGLASLGLGVCYALADVRGVRRWATPFVWLGTNAIAVFFVSTLVAKMMGRIRWRDAAGAVVSLKGFLWRDVFAPLASPKVASLAFALAFTLLFVGFAALLHRRRIFLKV